MELVSMHIFMQIILQYTRYGGSLPGTTQG